MIRSYPQPRWGGVRVSVRMLTSTASALWLSNSPAQQSFRDNEGSKGMTSDTKNWHTFFNVKFAAMGSWTAASTRHSN